MRRPVVRRSIRRPAPSAARSAVPSAVVSGSSDTTISRPSVSARNWQNHAFRVIPPSTETGAAMGCTASIAATTSACGRPRLRALPARGRAAWRRARGPSTPPAPAGPSAGRRALRARGRRRARARWRGRRRRPRSRPSRRTAPATAPSSSRPRRHRRRRRARRSGPPPPWPRRRSAGASPCRGERGARDGQDEGPRAEGDLRLPRRRAAMSPQGRLLVHDAGREPPPADPPRSPVVGTMAGSASIGTPKSAQSSASQAQVPSAMSEVREAVVGSVSHRPVRRWRKKASVVPSLSRPLRASAAASGTLAMIQPSFEAEKYGSSGSPARVSVSASAPSARRRSVTSAVRSSCQTMTGDTGSPVSASQARQLSPWLSRPTASAPAPAARQASTFARSSAGSCSTQPGRG
jgi:hypothetical protein